MTPRRRTITARFVQCEVPDWRPLARVASDHLMSSFMWMGEIATRRGERFHIYKHIDTRGSIHIDIEGKGLAYVWGRLELAGPRAAARPPPPTGWSAGPCTPEVPLKHPAV